MQQVYLDNAATTPLRTEVIDKMAEVLRSNFGNPSSTHSFGRSSKSIIEQCRKNIAAHFNVEASEICFTSGGTEADNLVLRSAVRDLGVDVIITSKIEHHAVLHTVEHLAKEFSIDLKFVEVDEQGHVNISHLKSLLITSKKPLVSLMHINNEIGNILDIEQVAKTVKSANGLFHSDTVQSIGHYKLDLAELPIDFLAASAHKFHGPKGVGFAFIRKNSGLRPLIIGGDQERGLRAGTEAVHNIAALDEALSIAYKNLEDEKAHIKTLKRYFIEQLNANIPNVTFNGASGHIDKSTYTLLSVRLPLKPEKAAMLQFQLDLKGIACSKGSACQSGSTQQSHVLSAILSHAELQKPSVRFSFSIYNTKTEVDYVVDVLKSLV
ncbi:cysteine desulfurase family protein [Ichthyenterobacterium sp. W332]|uniref:cysteine desulfurase n=1 Tax=Microcosmobacter mediterraneus TaxID=3075607 RepID=A0ABU2YGY4_9FLAO|nr:cysteine desulfurase family protein [Ichthyenterobacterium sp. W332]MDT0557437.1 cysteine desulfurase family protein [Ichthyenterobacterium sp. W332]